MNKEKKIAEIASQIEHCVQCPLFASRTYAVPGDGKTDASIMLIGEAPGKEEDQKGSPFVGAAGRYLNQVLKAHGLDRTNLFITNIVKCRPPRNRPPQQREVTICTSLYLFEQIALIDPMVIMLLGRVATRKMLGVQGLKEARGRVFEQDGRVYLAGYHPAATFYQEGIAARVEEDFALLAQVMHQRLAARAAL